MGHVGKLSPQLRAIALLYEQSHPKPDISGYSTILKMEKGTKVSETTLMKNFSNLKGSTNRWKQSNTLMFSRHYSMGPQDS